MTFLCPSFKKIYEVKGYEMPELEIIFEEYPY